MLKLQIRNCVISEAKTQCILDRNSTVGLPTVFLRIRYLPQRESWGIVYVDSFDDHTPDVNENRRYVTSRCKETLEHWNDNGKLDGRIKTDWKEWSWDIPEFAPLREYKVKMMVWNTLKDGKKEPFITIEDTFEVIDPDSSHYDRWRSVSV
jgi:hypothetical protein